MLLITDSFCVSATRVQKDPPSDWPPLFVVIAVASRPVGFDLHDELLSEGVVTEATPLPLVGRGTQTALHRVAVNITKLLLELPIVPDVEIVVPRLPKASKYKVRSSRTESL